MNVKELADVIVREPFHPYTLRLNNGTVYEVREVRNLGAPGDLRAVYWFELESPFRVVRIEASAITEVIE
jgi:hypothetical protein